MQRELAIVLARTDKPWGIGFLTWAIDIDTIAWTLDQHPHAVMLSFGDPGQFAPRVRAADVPLIMQVTDLDAYVDRWRDREAELAQDHETLKAFGQAVRDNDIDAISIWCSEAIDLINEIDSATELVRRLAADAVPALTRAASGDTSPRHA